MHVLGLKDNFKWLVYKDGFAVCDCDITWTFLLIFVWVRVFNEILQTGHKRLESTIGFA